MNCRMFLLAAIIGAFSLPAVAGEAFPVSQGEITYFNLQNEKDRDWRLLVNSVKVAVRAAIKPEAGPYTITGVFHVINVYPNLWLSGTGLMAANVLFGSCDENLSHVPRTDYLRTLKDTVGDTAVNGALKLGESISRSLCHVQKTAQCTLLWNETADHQVELTLKAENCSQEFRMHFSDEVQVQTKYVDTDVISTTVIQK